MALYEELEVAGQKYLLVHAGIADFDASVSLDEYMPEDFITTPLDPEREYYPDTITVAGHTSTEKYGEAGKIYRTENAILVDCGASFGGKLGCIRLEDGEEFYV
jgi:serine/threonine protein phosphatase 1